jgi:hypothetical protein
VKGKSLYEFPIHLGLGATAVAEPQFTGFEWYEAYGDRHADDLDEGRLVSLFRFEESWTSWEMHPEGEEVVCCLQGHMTLHQELPDGSKQTYELGPAVHHRGQGNDESPALSGGTMTEESRRFNFWFNALLIKRNPESNRD